MLDALKNTISDTRLLSFGRSRTRVHSKHQLTLRRRVREGETDFEEVILATEHYVLLNQNGRRQLFLPEEETRYLVSRFNGVLRPLSLDPETLRRFRRLKQHVTVTEHDPKEVDLRLHHSEYDERLRTSCLFEEPHRCLVMRSKTHRAVVRGTVLTTRIPVAALTCLDAFREDLNATRPYDWELEADEVIAAGLIEVLSRHSDQFREECLASATPDIKDQEEKDRYPSFKRVS